MALQLKMCTDRIIRSVRLYYHSGVCSINTTLSSSSVFLFAVFTSVDLIFLICEHKHMIQPLLDGCNASRVLAADHIADLFREFQLFLLNDLFILDDIDRDVVINESENIQIHEVDRALNLDNIFPAHFIALCVLDDGDAAVQLVQMQIFVNVHTPACLNMVKNKAFRDTSYIQCIFYHGRFLSIFEI